MVESIERALDITESSPNGERRVNLIKDRFFYSPKLDYFGLAKKHYMHENTVRNWESEFLELLCTVLGLTFVYSNDKIKVTARG
jgi:hypothetical protein